MYIAYAIQGSIPDYKDDAASGLNKIGTLPKTVGSSTQTSAQDVDQFNVIVLILILAVGGFAKILYFIRIFKDYGFIV